LAHGFRQVGRDAGAPRRLGVASLSEPRQQHQPGGRDRGIGFDPARQFQPVHAGQHQVENRQAIGRALRGGGAQALQRLRRVFHAASWSCIAVRDVALSSTTRTRRPARQAC
jgi:hypothetical protein